VKDLIAPAETETPPDENNNVFNVLMKASRSYNSFPTLRFVKQF
jgi:hypothetical protein